MLRRSISCFVLISALFGYVTAYLLLRPYRYQTRYTGGEIQTYVPDGSTVLLRKYGDSFFYPAQKIDQHMSGTDVRFGMSRFPWNHYEF